MSFFLHIIFLGAFLVLPPILLVVRFHRVTKISWWLIVLLISVLGWLFVNATIYFYYEHLGSLIEASPNPPQELIERWANDGANRVFGLFFGWLYGLLYSLPYLLIFAMALLMRKIARGSLAD